MKIAFRPLFGAIAAAVLTVTPVSAQQTVREKTAELIKPLQDANLRSMAEYNCNMALINQDRQNILDKMNGKTVPAASYDSIISKATECIGSVGPSSLFYSYRANAYARKGDNQSAFADFEKAIATSRTEKTRVVEQDKIFEDRADLNIRLFDRTKAEADLREAVKVNPSNYSAKDKLANLDAKIAEARKKAAIDNPQTAADFVVAGNEHYILGKYPLAVAAFDRSIALGPSAEAHLGKGKALWAQERAIPAVVEMNKAVALAPKDSETLAWRGYVNRDLKRWDEAIADLNAALLTADPKRKAALLDARGQAHTGKGSFAAAIKDHEAALAAAGDDKFVKVNALSGKADALRGQGKTEEAVASYTAAIAVAGSDHFAKLNAIPAWLGRGRIHASQGKADLAKADFNEVLKLSPDSKDAKAELAKLNGAAASVAAPQNAPRSGLAAQSAQPSAASGPQTAEQWAAEGRRQGANKNYDAAIKAFSECLRLQPAAFACHAFRGGVYGLNGDMAASKADFDKALQIGQTMQAPIYFIRATMFADLGERDEAVADFRAVLKIDPNNAQAKAALQRLGVQP